MKEKLMEKFESMPEEERLSLIEGIKEKVRISEIYNLQTEVKDLKDENGRLSRSYDDLASENRALYKVIRILADKPGRAYPLPEED